MCAHLFLTQRIRCKKKIRALNAKVSEAKQEHSVEVLELRAKVAQYAEQNNSLATAEGM